MGGQAPYLVNAFVNYTDRNGKLQMNMSYNVQGASLIVIGVGAVPDIYAEPFHSLNVTVSRTFGAKSNHRLAFGASNLLDSEREERYKAHGGSEGIYSVFAPGRTGSVAYSFSF